MSDGRTIRESYRDPGLPKTPPWNWAMTTAAVCDESFRRRVDMCSSPEHLRAAAEYEATSRERRWRIARLNQRRLTVEEHDV